MKLLLAFFLLLFSAPAFSQYYYKDIVGTRETADMIRNYMASKVSRVVLSGYDGNNVRSEDFYVEQQFSKNGILKTITRSGNVNESVLLSYTDQRGQVVRTIDSNSTSVSTTTYSYDDSGRLVSLVSHSSDSSGKTNTSEQHLWLYDNGRISGMMRIKNGRDTTHVAFKYDGNGNITEEAETRRGIRSEPVLYYYDARNRLTDIVRYSRKAQRLLPEYMFEYSPANQVIQKITVPPNSDNYLIWRYQYNGQGLKTKEAIYNKQKQLTGKIEYQYSFGS